VIVLGSDTVMFCRRIGGRSIVMRRTVIAVTVTRVHRAWTTIGATHRALFPRY
jgi:hypothetical protein